MIRSLVLLASVILSTASALAEPIVLTFDELPHVDSDGSVHEFYPGMFFLSIDARADVIVTEPGDQGWIWRTGSPTEQGPPTYPWDVGWVGNPFDFIGMEVRRSFTAEGLTVRGYRDNQLVGAVTAQFGDEVFTWYEFNLKNIDALQFVELGRESAPFQRGGYAFDNFTYVPEPKALMAFVLLASLLLRRRAA